MAYMQTSQYLPANAGGRRKHFKTTGAHKCLLTFSSEYSSFQYIQICLEPGSEFGVPTIRSVFFFFLNSSVSQAAPSCRPAFSAFEVELRINANETLA